MIGWARDLERREHMHVMRKVNDMSLVEKIILLCPYMSQYQPTCTNSVACLHTLSRPHSTANGVTIFHC